LTEKESTNVRSSEIETPVAVEPNTSISSVKSTRPIVAKDGDSGSGCLDFVEVEREMVSPKLELETEDWVLIS
jgi:hypothetical protein